VYFLLFLSFCVSVELVSFFRRKIVADSLNAKEQNSRKAAFEVQNLLVYSVILNSLYNIEFAFLKLGREIVISIYFLSFFILTHQAVITGEETKGLAQKAFGNVLL